MYCRRHHQMTVPN